MYRLEPIAVDDRGVELGLIDYNDRIMGIMDKNPDAKIGVMGHTPIKGVSAEYYSVTVQRELGMSYLDWNSMPIMERAKLVAHVKISNMVEVASAFKRWQNDAKQRAQHDKNSKTRAK